MSSTSGDEPDFRVPVDNGERPRLVEQREEQLTATDWFFSHAVRMRAAYRPGAATPGDETRGDDPADGDDRG